MPAAAREHAQQISMAKPIKTDLGLSKGGLDQGQKDYLAWLKALDPAAKSASSALGSLASDAKSKFTSAFADIKAAAKSFFDELHSHNLKAIDDAKALRDAQIQGPVTAMKAQLAAEQSARREAELRAALANATNPADQATAQQALSDFLAEQQITKAEEAANAAQKISDQQAADATTAENKRYDQQTKAFEKDLAQLQGELARHPEQWRKAQRDVLVLLAKYGVNYTAAGTALGKSFVDGLKSALADAEAAAKALAAAGTPKPKPKDTGGTQPGGYASGGSPPPGVPHAAGAWDISSTETALLHAREMVLRPDIADNVRALVGSAGMAGIVPMLAAARQRPAAGGGATGYGGFAGGALSAMQAIAPAGSSRTGGGTIVLQIDGGRGRAHRRRTPGRPRGPRHEPAAGAVRRLMARTDWQLLLLDGLYDFTGLAEWGVNIEEVLGRPATATFRLQDRDDPPGFGPFASMDPGGIGFSLEELDTQVRIIGRDDLLFRGKILAPSFDLPEGFPWRRWDCQAVDYQRTLYDRRRVGVPDGFQWSGPDADGNYTPVDPRPWLGNGLFLDNGGAGADAAIVAGILADPQIAGASVIDATTFVQGYLAAGALTNDPIPVDRAAPRAILEALAARVGGNLQYWLDPGLVSTGQWRQHWAVIPRWFEQETPDYFLALGLPSTRFRSRRRPPTSTTTRRTASPRSAAERSDSSPTTATAGSSTGSTAGSASRTTAGSSTRRAPAGSPSARTTRSPAAARIRTSWTRPRRSTPGRRSPPQPGPATPSRRGSCAAV